MPDSPADLPSYEIYQTERMLAALERDGFALIRAALPQAKVAAARGAIDLLQPGHWDLSGTHARYKNVFNRDPYWLEFLDRPGIIELAEAALGKDCHIIGQTAWRNAPGAGVREGLHVDYLATELAAALAQHALQPPMFIATVHFYLSAITRTLSPTYVVRGSHLAGRRPHPDETQWNGEPERAVLCDVGDALFFRSDLWHRGSAHSSGDETRYLLQVHYGRREMAQHFAPFLDWRFNPAVLAAATPRQRRLLGDHEPAAYD